MALRIAARQLSFENKYSRERLDDCRAWIDRPDVVFPGTQIRSAATPMRMTIPPA